MSNLDLLTPDNSALICIDHQPQMTFGVQSIDRQTLVNNVLGLAKAGKVFNVPTVLTTVETQSFSGHMWPELLDLFPEHPVIERTSMNSWEDAGFLGSGKVDRSEEAYLLCIVDRGLFGLPSD